MRTRFVLAVLLGTNMLSPSFAMELEDRDPKRTTALKTEGEPSSEDLLTLRQKQLAKLEKEAKEIAGFLKSNPNDTEALDHLGCLKTTIKLLQQDICATQFAQIEMNEVDAKATNLISASEKDTLERKNAGDWEKLPLDVFKLITFSLSLKDINKLPIISKYFNTHKEDIREAYFLNRHQNAGNLGSLPHDMFNRITEYLSINDILNVALTCQYTKGKAQEFLNWHAATFLIKETKTLRLAQFIWSQEELKQIGPKGSTVVPKRIKFMQKIYNHLKRGYPSNYLNHLAACHLPWLDYDAYFEPFQIILSYAPQLFPYSSVSNGWGSINVAIPAHINNQQLEAYCKIIGNYYEKLSLKNMSLSECAEFITIMLGLKQEQIEARVAAIQPHLEFINSISSKMSKHRLIAGFLEKAEPDEIPTRLNMLKESSVLDSLEDDENKEMKFSFMSELAAGNASQIKAFLDHIKEIYREVPYKGMWQDFTRYFMTLPADEISNRIKVIKNHAEKFIKLDQQNPDYALEYEKILIALSSASSTMMEVIMGHIFDFINKDLSCEDTIRIIQALAEGTPEKIKILAKDLLTFIPKSMKAEPLKLIETWFKGTEGQMQAIAKNSVSFFPESMDPDIYIETIWSLLKGTVEQINAVAKNFSSLFSEEMGIYERRNIIKTLFEVGTAKQIEAIAENSSSFFFIKNMRAYDRQRLLETLLSKTEAEIRAIAKNSVSFFPENMDPDVYIETIRSLLKGTVEQINAVAKNFSSLFVEEIDLYERRNIIETLFENETAEKLAAIVENSPSLFRRIFGERARIYMIRELCKGTTGQIKAIAKNEPHLFTENMDYDDEPGNFVKVLLEAPASKMQLITENAPLFFSNFENIYDRSYYTLALMKGTEAQIKSIIKKYPSLFTEDMGIYSRISIIEGEFSKIAETETAPEPIQITQRAEPIAKKSEVPLFSTVIKSAVNLWNKTLLKRENLTRFYKL